MWYHGTAPGIEDILCCYDDCFISDDKYEILKAIESLLKSDLATINWLCKIPACMRNVLFWFKAYRRYEYTVNALANRIDLAVTRNISYEEVNLYRMNK